MPWERLECSMDGGCGDWPKLFVRLWNMCSGSTWEVVDWRRSRQKFRTAGWGKRQKTRDMPQITLVNGGFGGFQTFILTRTFQESVPGWVMRADRNGILRKKVSGQSEKPVFLLFLGVSRLVENSLSLAACSPSFSTKWGEYLTHRRSQPSVERKWTYTNFLLSTKHFILIIPLNSHRNSTPIYSYDYQPKTPSNQEETLPKSYNLKFVELGFKARVLWLQRSYHFQITWNWVS